MDARAPVDGISMRFTPARQTDQTSGVTRIDDTRLRRYDPFANSVGMRAVKTMIDAAAATDATVLISGESGVGKEVVARAIHQASARSGHTFVKVSCAGLPPDLLETELFGHERGAFTGVDRRKPGKFELANDGTVFFDEIGELPLPLQVKLLHALQDREFSRVSIHHDLRVDSRVIAATDRDLSRLVDQGRFREDLYSRLNVVAIDVPPLRERIEEIPILVETFLDRYTRQYRRQRDVISPATMQLFHAYPWPGNVRELENIMKRIVLLGSQDWLVEELTDTDALSAPGAPPLPAAARLSLTPGPGPGEDGPSLAAIARAAALQAERRALEQVLDRVHWNRRRAARLLKVSYRTLRRKIEQCGLLED
jgi:two-component system response regulator AtoC